MDLPALSMSSVVDSLLILPKPLTRCVF
jgi:hypothetical protein